MLWDHALRLLGLFLAGGRAGSPSQPPSCRARISTSARRGRPRPALLSGADRRRLARAAVPSARRAAAQRRRSADAARARRDGAALLRAAAPCRRAIGIRRLRVRARGRRHEGGGSGARAAAANSGARLRRDARRQRGTRGPARRQGTWLAGSRRSRRTRIGPTRTRRRARDLDLLRRARSPVSSSNAGRALLGAGRPPSAHARRARHRHVARRMLPARRAGCSVRRPRRSGRRSSGDARRCHAGSVMSRRRPSTEAASITARRGCAAALRGGADARAAEAADQPRTVTPIRPSTTTKAITEAHDQRSLRTEQCYPSAVSSSPPTQGARSGPGGPLRSGFPARKPQDNNEL